MDFKMFILCLVLFALIKGTDSTTQIPTSLNGPTGLSEDAFYKGVSDKPHFVMFYSRRQVATYIFIGQEFQFYFRLKFMLFIIYIF